MVNIPEELRYSEDHEWAMRDGDVVVVGITDHAQGQLGDVVYVELPEVGDEVTKGEPFGTVESTKAVSELFAPVSGVVAEVNDALADTPEMVNDDPYGDGWLIHIEPTAPGDWDELMDAEGYAVHIEGDD